MSYYSYHNTAKKLISQGKLIEYYYTNRHNRISPALVLIFDDPVHPCMPIRRERWQEYEALLGIDGETLSVDFPLY